MTLTPDTPIPTKARRGIRYLIKQQPGFRDWHMGLWASRDVPNRVLLMYALTKPWLARRVAAIIGLHGGRE